MSNKGTGGPAFPVKIENTTQEDMNCLGVTIPSGMWLQCYGMNLRDYFAMHANDEDIAKHYLYDEKEMDDFYKRAEKGSFPGMHPKPINTREQARYAFADAMLQERSK